MTADAIDFLRDDIGEWLLFVIIPFLALSGLKAKELKQSGWRTTTRAVATRLLIGCLIATPITGFLMVWQRWPPQYFIKLRLESDRVILGYRWPEPELAIPFGDVRNVQIIKSGTRRRPCSRVRVQTTAETYRSYGFGQLNEGEIAVMDKLRERVGTNSVDPKK